MTKLLIRSSFQDSQDSFSVHPKLVKKLRVVYDKFDEGQKEEFFQHFIFYLKLPISGIHERSPFIERILEFVAKFACSFLEKEKDKTNDSKKDKDEGNKDKDESTESLDESVETESDDEDEEMPQFMHRLFNWLLDNHSVEGVDARLHVCQLLNKLLKYMGAEACIDDDLYNKIYYGMLDRLKDRVADIRSQAVTALQRLQDPKDENCPIIKAYLFHLAHDPNSIVRRTIVRCIGATRLTLPHILERTRDADDGVRKAAYKFLSEKVHLKSLTIGQREGVLQRGLKERSEGARKVVEKEMLPSWLRLSNHNIIQFLHHLDVGNCEQNFKVGQQMSAPSGALEVLFKDMSFNDLINNFQYLDQTKLIPTDKLTPETALYWRVLIQFLSKEGSDDHLDKLRPELSPFCDYVRAFVLSATSADDDDINWEFIAKELIIMTSFYDLGDEVGRRNLIKLVKDLLISDRTTPSLIPQLIHIFTKVEKNAQSRIDQIAEVIAELKDPMTEPAAALEPEQPMDTSEPVIDQKLIRSLNLEIAKLRVDMASCQEALDCAINEQDFVKAQEVKVKMQEFDAKRTEFEIQIQAEKNKTNKVVETSPVLISESVNTLPERSDDPAVTLKCLKLLVATLQDPGISQLNATLHTLLEEMVVKAVQSEIASIRKEAIQALACFCLRSPDDARTHMLLLLQAAHIDVSEVRIAAISAVIDLLMRHGLSSFITDKGGDSIGLDRLNISGTEGELSETSSSIETALDSDMATRGAALSQAELNSQGGNSVVVILSKMLDEPDLELRTEVAEGLCKLLMIGSISSPKLLSRLLLMWYNPMTESDSKLRHILGTFFPLYASMSKVHQMALASSFIPTMKVLFDAPITSPLADIDTEDVGMFLVHLSREDLLQGYQPSKPSLESESTVSSVHDSLAFTVCNEILSAPDSYQTKVLVKILTNLQITVNNYVSLRELKVLSEQLLIHVREKLCRKPLEKFDRNITDWLSRDPAKAKEDAVEKRPASVVEERLMDETTATPGKKKRFLFSQSSLNNSLLVDPDQNETTARDETEDNNTTFPSPRKIPSPVCSRVDTQASLEDTINRTKELDLHDNNEPDRDDGVVPDEDAGPPDFPDVRPEITIVPGTPESSIQSSQDVDMVVDTPESEIFSSAGSTSRVLETSSASSSEAEDSPVRRSSRRSSPAPSKLTTTSKSTSKVSSGKQTTRLGDKPSRDAPARARDTASPATRAARNTASPAARAISKSTSAKAVTNGIQKAKNTPKTTSKEASKSSNRLSSPPRQKRVVEIPVSPGISRAGRNNSPRIDYKTGKSLVTSDKENSPVSVSSSQEISPRKTRLSRSNSPFVNGNVENSGSGTPGRKRVHPPPSQESRNSSPEKRNKAPRSKTPPKSVGRYAVKGVKALAGSKTEEIRRSSRKGLAGTGSDSDGSGVASPSLRKSKRSGK